jgi:hypothetical protein
MPFLTVKALVWLMQLLRSPAIRIRYRAHRVGTRPQRTAAVVGRTVDAPRSKGAVRTFRDHKSAEGRQGDASDCAIPLR